MQDMQCPPVRIRVDRNRSHPHLAASTNYPQSDLAAICNQYFFCRSSQAAILQQLYNRKTAPPPRTKEASHRGRPPILQATAATASSRHPALLFPSSVHLPCVRPWLSGSNRPPEPYRLSE